jgi:hypothetical protein
LNRSRALGPVCLAAWSSTSSAGNGHSASDTDRTLPFSVVFSARLPTYLRNPHCTEPLCTPTARVPLTFIDTEVGIAA